VGGLAAIFVSTGPALLVFARATGAWACLGTLSPATLQLVEKFGNGQFWRDLLVNGLVLLFTVSWNKDQEYPAKAIVKFNKKVG
jgi:hypothetical protein